MLGIGLLLAAALPRSDRRFRTGYKNNAVPSNGLLLACFGFLAAGALCLWMGSSGNGSSSHEDARTAFERPPATPAAQISVPDPTTALQQCIAAAGACNSPENPALRCVKQLTNRHDLPAICSVVVKGGPGSDVCEGMLHPFDCCDALNSNLRDFCHSLLSGRKKHSAAGQNE